MIPYEIREAIRALHQQGRAIREISRALKVSRNTGTCPRPGSHGSTAGIVPALQE